MPIFSLNTEHKIEQLFDRLYDGASEAGIATHRSGETVLRIGSVCMRTNSGDIVKRVGFDPQGRATHPEFTHWLANIAWPESGPPAYRGISLERHATGLLVAKSVIDINPGEGHRYSYWLHMVRPATDGVIHTRIAGEVTTSTNPEVFPKALEECTDTPFEEGQFPSVLSPDEIYSFTTSVRDSGEIPIR